MGPTAKKLIRELRSHRRSNVVDLGAAREVKQHAQELRAALSDAGKPRALPPNMRRWMDPFGALSGITSMLLGSPSLRKVRHKIDAAQEEYMPGGPPMSPLLDSTYVSWYMADLHIGPRKETLCSILCDLAPLLRLPDEIVEVARRFERTHLDIYRAENLPNGRVKLTRLLDGSSVNAELAEIVPTDNGLWLARVLPPFDPAVNDDSVVWGAPYLLMSEGGEQEWLAFFERVAPGLAGEARAAALVQYFKGGTPNHMLEYIVNGYYGQAPNSTVVLTGVPDRPETQPHHPDFEPLSSSTASADPLRNVRIRLQQIADNHDFVDTQHIFDVVREQIGAPELPETPEHHRIVQAAFRMYAQLDDDGHSAVEYLARQREKLSEAERTVLASIEAGWYSVFEVREVVLDEGLQLMDMFRRKRLWVHERSATHQLKAGDVLAGWILAEEGERYTLDGAALYLPAPLGRPFIEPLKTIRQGLIRQYSRLSRTKINGLLVPYVVGFHTALHAGMSIRIASGAE